MSKRVEEKAMDAWAIYEYREHPKGLYHTCFVDGYKEGYEQAEKDLALTWEDVAILITIYEQEVEAGNISRYEDEGAPSLKEASEIILRKFNEIRKK